VGIAAAADTTSQGRDLNLIKILWCALLAGGDVVLWMAMDDLGAFPVIEGSVTTTSRRGLRRVRPSVLRISTRTAHSPAVSSEDRRSYASFGVGWLNSPLSGPAQVVWSGALAQDRRGRRAGFSCGRLSVGGDDELEREGRCG